MNFEYIRVFREQLEFKGLKIAQAPDFIKLQTGYEISGEQAYEFLSEKRDSCPQTPMVKVWEQAFQITLAARYYGADQAFARKEKKR
jgi:hypothetical protein